MSESKHNKNSDVAAAGLPSGDNADAQLRRTGINPERLSVVKLGCRSHLTGVPSWLWRLGSGLLLWSLALLFHSPLAQLSPYLQTAIKLVIGLIILIAA